MLNKCPACNSGNLKNLGKPKNQTNDSKYDVIKCMKCFLEWSIPFPSHDELKLHYNSYYSNRFRRILKSKLKIVRDLATLKYLREYYFISKAKKYKNIKKFLDYGCGEGEMLMIGKKLGWDCIGVEYSDELSEKFKLMGVKVIISQDIENLNIERNSIDLILLKHLIEHVPDIRLFLKQVKNYLSEKGIIAIKTPSNTSLRAITGTANWHYVNPPEHLWSFNTKNFRLILENNGFEVLEIRNSMIIDELICYARLKI